MTGFYTYPERTPDWSCRLRHRSSWQTGVGYSVDLSYRGPLYDGRDRTKGKVRLDANLRPEAIDTQPVLISSEYDDIRPFVLSVISREHFMAEKVGALVVRGKPRDLYVWLLVNQGVTASDALIQTKLDSRSGLVARGVEGRCSPCGSRLEA